jgi:hypothetical protein
MRLLDRCASNMGFPGAVHMSSFAEPGELLMKEASVIEGSHVQISPRLIEFGKNGTITAELIMAEIVKPRCGFTRRVDDFEDFKYLFISFLYFFLLIFPCFLLFCFIFYFLYCFFFASTCTPSK